MGFITSQIDETGKQAAKLQKGIYLALLVYLIHIVLSFTLTTMYSTSLIGPIFSLVGLLVGIGIIGASKRDHTMTCYIGVLAVELVLGLIGTALWVVEGVVMNNSKIDALGLRDRSDTTPVSIAISLAATIPVVILLNLYCLVQAAKFKIILKEEQKQVRTLKLEQRVQLLVQELVMQQSLTATQPMVNIPSSPMALKGSTSYPRRALSRSTSSRYGRPPKKDQQGPPPAPSLRGDDVDVVDPVSAV